MGEALKQFVLVLEALGVLLSDGLEEVAQGSVLLLLSEFKAAVGDSGEDASGAAVADITVGEGLKDIFDGFLESLLIEIDDRGRVGAPVGGNLGAGGAGVGGGSGLICGAGSGAGGGVRLAGIVVAAEV